MSKKGLSFDEKKARMLQLLYERKEFFQLKELERIAPKEKGITQNTVKDVLLALVDDGSVDTDKVGGSIYYWSFPSKVMNLKKRKLEELETRLEASSKQLKLANEHVKVAQSNENDTKEINNTILQVNKLQHIKESLIKQVNVYKQSDPTKVEEMERQINPLKEAANRWTDNVFTVKSWCKRKFMIEEKVLNKQFGIPEDLDYIV